jgi:hypothetical protein
VGALCVHTRRGVGALSTQALMNPLYGPRGMDLLARRQSARRSHRCLTAADAGRDQRQLHVLPARARQGRGLDRRACVDWCGHRLGEDFSVAGNMLAGPQVIEATAQGFIATRGQDLAERLLAAMAPAKRPAATSAASRPRPCASRPTRTIRAGPARRRPRRAACANCSACTTRAWSATSPSWPAWPAARPGGHHRPRADRSRIERFQRERSGAALMAVLEVRGLRTEFA